MKVMALEFRVAHTLFAVEMKDVKHLFEIEEKDILTFPDMPECLAGIVRYNNYVYPLISLKKVFNLEGEDSDTAFVLIYENKEYAILIDEVIKIDEIDKKSNFLIDVFEDGDKLIEEFNLSFLKNIDIPVFYNKKNIEVVKNYHKDQESFLVFECNNEFLGIEISLIRKIEEYSGENLILNGVLPIVDFSKVYKKCEQTNVLVLEFERSLGVNIGEVIDVVFVDKEKIVKANGMFNRYFLYQNKEVKVFDNEYLKTKINKFGVHLLKENKKKIINTLEILIVDVFGVKIAIRMQNILGLYDYNEGKLNVSTKSKYIKGILPTGKGAVYIISLEEVFNKKYTLSEDSKIILLKHKTTKALLVDKIEDLINVSVDNVIEAKSTNYIGGMVLYKDKMIPLFNLDWPEGI